MNKIMSLVFASESEQKLNELTIHRTTASLPFCGRYRFIDFTLSNLVNSNITTIGIIARSNYLSLMDHIRMGRDWDLNRKNSGIAIFPPYVSNTSRSVYKGKIEALYSMIDYMDTNKEEYVIITNSNIAANIDYDEVFSKHIDSGADVTMLTYQSCPTGNTRVIVETNDEDVVTKMIVKNTKSTEEQEIGLNIYLIKKDLLIKMVEDAYEQGFMEFERHLLLPNLDKLKIVAFKLEGYAAIIDDVNTYYQISMKMLDGNIRNDLFYRAGKIYTKTKDSVPTVYRDNAVVKNSLIADGCDINGVVENSILFRGVVVEQGAVVKNSIVMENGVIMRCANLSYTITDKNVRVTENRVISGYDTYPVVIVKDKEV